MPSFSCDGCGDVVKKPKLDSHSMRCGASVTCLDCSTTFNGPASWKPHTTCISEAEKYQKSLYQAPKNKKSNDHHQKPPSQKVSNLPPPPIAPINLPSIVNTTESPVTASEKPLDNVEQAGPKETKEKRSKKDKKRKLKSVDQQVEPDTTHPTEATTESKSKKEKLTPVGDELENAQDETSDSPQSKKDPDESSAPPPKKKKQSRAKNSTGGRAPTQDCVVHKALPNPITDKEAIVAIRAALKRSPVSINDMIDAVLETVTHNQCEKLPNEAWRSGIRSLFRDHLKFVGKTFGPNLTVGLTWNDCPV